MTVDDKGTTHVDLSSIYFVSPTLESKEKGDEGLYAAIDAARLARALRGATIRPHVRANPSINPNAINLAPPPRQWDAPSLAERANAELLAAISGGDAAVWQYDVEPPVALPDEGELEALRPVLGRIRRVHPHPGMRYDEVVRLERLLTLHGAAVTCLDLGDGVVMPRNRTEASPETVLAKMEELRQRFPLPVPKQKRTNMDDDRSDAEEEDEEEVEDEVDLGTNEELKAWCQSQQVEYTDYNEAIRLRTAYELDAFRNICAMLEKDKKIRVLLLSHNEIGGSPPKPGEDPNNKEEEEDERVSLIPLRLLAKVIDANETIKVLDLSHNALGPHGFGIIGKALTKNIAIAALDLSSNMLNAPPPETQEDPEYVEEDPVFGETYSGLEALSEVIKKNKFLRFLRLADNQIHAGGEGEEPSAADPAEMNPESDATTPNVEEWQDLPLWRLVGPLREYHRLRALDLSGNALGPDGARMLATALADNHSLEVLDLTGNDIGPRGLHYIAKLVLSAPTSALHTLILRRNALAGRRTSRAQQKMALAAAEATALALDGNTRLRRLSLAANYLGPTICAALLRTVSRATALEELDLSSNDACGEVSAPHDTTALYAIAVALYGTALCSRRPSLTVLRLGDNNIRAEGTQVLFPAAAEMPYVLREIDLSRNAIGNRLDAVGHLLRRSPTLERLNLAYNAITTATTLVPALSVNTGLTELDLSHNKLGSQRELYCTDKTAQIAGVTSLLHVMAKHPSLENVSLSHNEFNAVHGPIILESLCARSEAQRPFRRLDISGNPDLQQSDIEHMVQAVGARSGVEAFYVSSSYPLANYDPAGYDQTSLLQVLQETVSRTPSLLDINCDLQRCSVPEEDSGTWAGEIIGDMRRRLLLNALLATKV